MAIVQQLLFLASISVAGYFIFKRVKFLRRNILLGKPVGSVGDSSERLKQTLLIAFGQKKMFDKPFVGFMHLLIYVGFLIINVELLEIVLDGLTGQHRLFATILGSLYPLLINFFELLALGVVVSCVIFFARRNFLKIDRFQKPELQGFPMKDANTILVWEVVLMFCLYTMNATDSILQIRVEESEYIKNHFTPVGSFAISSSLIPIYKGLGTSVLLVIERMAWWIHILGIMGFAAYVTYSKHLHIMLAFPQVYYANLKPKGEIENMATVTKEVKIMLGLEQPDANPAPVGTFGVKEVTDLKWTDILSAYSCTECGRCTQACPANQTGKKLSPRKIMMDVRDRADELGNLLDSGKDINDGKSLYGTYTTKEELMACTTCNACAEACPLNINPLSIILQERRYIAMEESGTPASWNSMFQNIENNQAPWAFSSSDRFKWGEDVRS
jgi:heterodisulfide reductase subunit C